MIRAPIDRVLRRVVAALQASDLPALAVRPFTRTEAFVLEHSGGRVDAGDGGNGRPGGDRWDGATGSSSSSSSNSSCRGGELRLADQVGAPCGFILYARVAFDGGEPLLLDRQPFRCACPAAGWRRAAVALALDRVPLGGGRFHQPPPLEVAYEAAGRPAGRALFEVDLTAPCPY